MFAMQSVAFSVSTGTTTSIPLPGSGVIERLDWDIQFTPTTLGTGLAEASVQISTAQRAFTGKSSSNDLLSVISVGGGPVVANGGTISISKSVLVGMHFGSGTVLNLFTAISSGAGWIHLVVFFRPI